MKYNIGDFAKMEKKIDEDLVARFAELTGDNNPIHIDDEAGKKSIFGKRVAHGMISASIISAVIGMQLPGEGAIYLGQNIKFLAPVMIGDTVTAYVEVVEIANEEKGILKLHTYVRNQDEKMVLDGEAIVKI